VRRQHRWMPTIKQTPWGHRPYLFRCWAAADASASNLPDGAHGFADGTAWARQRLPARSFDPQHTRSLAAFRQTPPAICAAAAPAPGRGVLPQHADFCLGHAGPAFARHGGDRTLLASARPLFDRHQLPGPLPLTPVLTAPANNACTASSGPVAHHPTFPHHRPRMPPHPTLAFPQHGIHAGAPLACCWPPLLPPFPPRACL